MNNIFDTQYRQDVLACDPADEPGNQENGFSDRALKYIREKPHWGVLHDADQMTEMTGSCGDTLSLYLKIGQDRITDVKFLVLGCTGLLSAAMALADLILNNSLAHARTIDDGEIFKALNGIPSEKHHCIQLTVKTLHAALDAYENRQGKVR